MHDKTEELRKKEATIIMARTPQERGRMAMDLNERASFLEKNDIIAKYPHYTTREVVAELFRRNYGNDFTLEEVVEIMEEIRNS